MTNKQLLTLVSKWQKALGLANWKLHIHIDNNLPAYGKTIWKWEYMSGDVYLNPVMHLEEPDPDEELEATVVHELMHIVLCPAWTDIGDDEHKRLMLERMTEEVTRIMLDNIGSLR